MISDFTRDSTGMPPLDHVLGGGLVAASVVLLASPTGIGTSSLTLQMLAGLGRRCLYVSGAETCEQVAATARRVNALSNQLYVLSETNLGRIFARARVLRAQTIAIDSIQKVICDDVGGGAGSPTQLNECTARLINYAKTTDTTVWIIGHMTSDGDIAGPKTIEYSVDVVLELSQGAKFDGTERFLRCLRKNRFGPTGVVGHFELTAKGFVPVDADGRERALNDPGQHEPILRVSCPLCRGPADVDWRGDHGILLDHRRTMTGGLYEGNPDHEIVIEECDVIVDCPIVGAIVKRRAFPPTRES